MSECHVKHEMYIYVCMYVYVCAHVSLYVCV